MGKKYDKLAEDIVNYVGGKDNIKSLLHCMTRLRFQLYDPEKADVKQLEALDGVVKVIVSGLQYQVVIGQHVGEVMDAIEKVTGTVYGGKIDVQEPEDIQKTWKEKLEPKNVANVFLDTVTSIIGPILGVLCGAAFIKSIVLMCSTFGWLASDSTTYQILYAIGDSTFYFLPMFLAYTAAKKFGADRFVSVAIAGMMVYPDIISIYSSGVSADIFGIPVIMTQYTSTVLPIIVTVYFLSRFEKLLRRAIPKVLQTVFVPVISLFVVSVAALLVIGPVTSFLGTSIGNALNALMNFCPPVAGFVVGVLWPCLIVAGVQMGVVPIFLNNIAVNGTDSLRPPSFGWNMAMTGALIGIWLKTKKQSVKDVALPAFVASGIGGITEPGLYGLLLKYKRTFVIACLCTGVGGIVVASAGVSFSALVNINVITLPAIIALGGVPMAISMAIAFFGSALLTYFIGFNDSMVDE